MVQLRRVFVALIAMLAMVPSAQGSIITGGDAASQATADVILDIVFVIDTSGSMSDDISAIGSVALAAVRGVSCPEIDIWVRARFMGINGVSGPVFNENARTLVDSLNGAALPFTNSTEDNGPIVTDLATWYPFDAATLPGQTKVKAIVTIGDEGTQDGSPVNQADYDAAVLANSTAIANDVLLFSWVTNDPFAGVPTLFQRMAEGGLAPAPFTGAFGNTGGKFIDGSAGSLDVQAVLEEILCTAADTGVTVPEPTTCLIWALGAVGFGLAGRRRQVR